VIGSTFSGTCSALEGGSVRGRLPLSIGVQLVGGRWATNSFNNGLPPGGAIDNMIFAKRKSSQMKEGSDRS